ncbi:MAG: phosphatidylglycerophosphatase A [Desulfovibrionales bacterium]
MGLNSERSQENPTPGHLDRLATEIACLSFIGRMPVGPGSWGSLAALVFAPWTILMQPFPIRAALLVILFFAGAYVCTKAETVLGRKDPQSVVIDEVLGQWTCLAALPSITVWELVAGFVLFRFFDIVKPYPIKRSEFWLPKGYGIMLDDLFAGIYAALGLLALHFLAFAS